MSRTFRFGHDEWYVLKVIEYNLGTSLYRFALQHKLSRQELVKDNNKIQQFSQKFVARIFARGHRYSRSKIKFHAKARRKMNKNLRRINKVELSKQLTILDYEANYTPIRSSFWDWFYW